MHEVNLLQVSGGMSSNGPTPNTYRGAENEESDELQRVLHLSRLEAEVSALSESEQIQIAIRQSLEPTAPIGIQDQSGEADGIGTENPCQNEDKSPQQTRNLITTPRASLVGSPGSQSNLVQERKRDRTPTPTSVRVPEHTEELGFGSSPGRSYNSFTPPSKRLRSLLSPRSASCASHCASHSSLPLPSSSLSNRSPVLFPSSSSRSQIKGSVSNHERPRLEQDPQAMAEPLMISPLKPTNSTKECTVRVAPRWRTALMEQVPLPGATGAFMSSKQSTDTSYSEKKNLEDKKDSAFHSSPSLPSLLLGGSPGSPARPIPITRGQGAALDLLYFPHWLSTKTCRELRRFMLHEMDWFQVQYTRPSTGQEIITPRFTTAYVLPCSYLHPPAALRPSLTSERLSDKNEGTVRDQDSSCKNGHKIKRREEEQVRTPEKRSWGVFSPLPAPLRTLLELVQQGTRCEFNSVICNYYESGTQRIGYHADDEAYLGPRPNIASITLGASREFICRPKKQGAVNRPGTSSGATALGNTSAGPPPQQQQKWSPLTLSLDEGDLLLMRGRTQDQAEHSVPPRQGVGEGRINLTFRLLQHASGASSEFFSFSLSTLHLNLVLDPVGLWQGLIYTLD